MADGVRIQWCPSCETWRDSKLVKRELLKSSVASSAMGPFEFEYHLKTNQCNSCNEEFVTTRLAKPSSENSWNILRELRKLASGFRGSDQDLDWVI